ELIAQRLGVPTAQVHAKRQDPRPIGRCAAGFPAPADERLGPLCSSATHELLDESALADARLAAHEEQSRLAGTCLFETSAELPQLAFPPHEGPGAAYTHTLLGDVGLGPARGPERRVLGKDRPLKVFERLAWLQAELVGQESACLLVALECFGL